MNWIDVILGREPALDQAEEDLGKPDELEAASLPHHVDRCAKRWSLSYRLSRSNHAQLAQVRLFLAILIIFMAANSPIGAKIVERLGL